MQRFVFGVVGAICLASALETGPHAQTGRRANWLTDGGDPQRTSWQRNETLISPATVREMTLIWKVKLDNQPRQMHNLFAPLIIGDVQVAGRAARDRHRRRRLRQYLRHRRREGHADLEAPFRQHVRGHRPRRRPALSRRPDGHADCGAD